MGHPEGWLHVCREHSRSTGDVVIHEHARAGGEDGHLERTRFVHEGAPSLSSFIVITIS